jgi:hypothetical protein
VKRSRICLAVHTSVVVAGVLLLVPCAAVAGRDPNSPLLHPVASDVRAATSLLLTRAILGTRFRASPSGTSPTNNSGSCAGFDPNLRALTETAEVYGDLLTDRSEGLLFTSEAEVYSSSVEAAKAQALETAPGAGRCVGSLAEKSAGTNAVVLKKKITPVSLSLGDVRVKAWDAELLVRVNGRQLPVEATLFVYRHRRAVSFLFISGLESRAIGRYSHTASAQMVKALLRANLG